MGIRNRLLSDGRANATAAWALTGVLAATVGENVLDGDLLWAGFAVVAGGLVALPAALDGDRELMPPWEVVALVALPVAVRSLATGRLLQLASYLSVAALALLVAVELDAFTDVEMTAGFAVGFVVVTTMSAAGTWAVAQWYADQLLGTDFLTTPDALMWDLVAASAMGVVAGVVFELYFHDRSFRGEPA